jgi:DNA-binding transcriptional LysR family regulator
MELARRQHLTQTADAMVVFAFANNQQQYLTTEDELGVKLFDRVGRNIL